jgi:hypothetical protein
MREIAAALFATCLFAAGASAQDAQDLQDLRDLSIGTKVADMPTTGFYEFACGTNGGPPARKLSGWEGFRDCPPEPSGLREVFVRYDDEGDFISRVVKDVDGEGIPIDKYSGTKIAGHPVILSVLFDNDGVMQGLRAVSDPRAEVDQRRRAFLLRIRVFNRYFPEDWQCADLPADPGQSPVGGLFLKQRCYKVFRGVRQVVMNTNFFRKAGQTGFDAQGQRLEGDYENSARFEVWSMSVQVPRN